MKALVTGGTGFVGSHIARALAAAGHEVCVLHRPTSKLTALEGVPFESAHGDLLDREAVRAACAGCDWVFHTAAVAAYWREAQQRLFEVNVRGTQVVLEAAREVGVKRVIFTSSAAAVGMRADQQPADESVPFNLPPERFPYGYSKVLAEAAAIKAAERGQEVVILNPVVVTGPGDLNVISGDFILQIKRLGWRLPVPPGGVAVTDVRDVAQAHVAAAELGESGRRYILGTENVLYDHWGALIADATGVARPGFPMPHWGIKMAAALVSAARDRGIELPVDGDQLRFSARRLWFDFSAAHRDLGAPQIPMQQSVRDTYDWYVAHGYVSLNGNGRANGRRG
ncbi:MAG: NAD-dependent epimerase/dehydratase family protein [Chloroflexi bacterium]|nr:NAD-dependent epimerase/dehydratase family protein [Chloroflexota bacterium]